MMCCCNSKTLVLLLLRLLILLLSLFSTVPHVANSSPLSNITIGSSLNLTSSEDQRYWLSSSGNFAFGFYPVSCGERNTAADGVQCYVVGIWNAASTKKTLVWVANRDDVPLSDSSSSIILTTNGILLVQPVPALSKGIAVPVLSNIQELASYATILDNGNLVVYNSDSGVIWESFNYPTDTILPGQTLKPGSSLVSRSGRSESDYSSGIYTLSVENNGILVQVYTYDGAINPHSIEVIDRIYSTKHGDEHVEMNLDLNGHLYLVDQSGSIIKNLIKRKNQLLPNNSSQVMFRTTLDSDGALRLYREEMGSGNKETSLQLTSKPPDWDISVFYWLVLSFILAIGLIAVLSEVFEALIFHCKAKNQRTTEGDLELGTI